MCVSMISGRGNASASSPATAAAECTCLPALAISARSSSTPLSSFPLCACTATTGTRKCRLSFSRSIFLPCFSATSIIDSATTAGRPNSSTCVTRYKLRSRLLASARTTITSGRGVPEICPSNTCRATCSSGLRLASE